MKGKKLRDIGVAPSTDMGGVLKEKMGHGKENERRSENEFHHLICLGFILPTFCSRHQKYENDLFKVTYSRPKEEFQIW